MEDKFRFTHEERNTLLRDLRKIFKQGDEREFMRILRKYGIKDEDPRFSEIVKLFQSMRAGKS